MFSMTRRLHEEPDLDARASAWHALDALVKDDLKLIAVQRGLSDSGTKQELIRLCARDVSYYKTYPARLLTIPTGSWSAMVSNQPT